MRRDTLLDFFDDFASLTAEFLVHDDGYRTRHYRYADVGAAARAAGHRLDAAGLGKGDCAIIWGENRPGWIIAFWACLLRGVVVVPVDYRATPDFLERVARAVDAKLLLVGDEVERRPTPESTSAPVWRLSALEEHGPPPPPLRPVPLAADDVAEIIFTSGATAEPKGVVITHRNVLANIVPVEREMLKYRRYARPFAPIRFLNLLPLSHMFGQAMATFIPAMLPGVVVFMRGYHPPEIVRQIRTRRVSVVVCVPKILDVLKDYVERRVPGAAVEAPAGERWWRRWWRYREVHRALGWKFWSFVVGAAPLDPALERAWGRLGYVVVQGYGLTETAPIVTLNHPFSARAGSVGRPIAGVEVRIAEDGEILVRGDNVTKGYFNAPEDTARAFDDGWLHTGDIGGFDESGRLYIRGRKKEMIVTPEGLNVFPDDIERALADVPGVVEAGVVGRTWDGEERVHAVLVLEPGTSADEVVRQANAALQDHQKIRSASVWSTGALPRTEGTRKLRRRELKAWVEGTATTSPPARETRALESVLARFAHGPAALVDATTIGELGLSSLERVELMMALEERFETTLEEHAFAAARTVGDLRMLVDPEARGFGGGRPSTAGAAPGATTGATMPGATTTGAARTGATTTPVSDVDGFAFPSWNRHWVVRGIRRLSLATWILPLARLFAWIEVTGVEHLRALEGPVLFAANHQSHFDTPAVLCALPPRWRYRLAVAMAKEFFRAHFHPAEHSARAVLTNRVNYGLAAFYFNAFPLPQREAGTRQTLRYMGELFADGHSVLIFPEGRRTQHGEIQPFRQGVAMIGARLGVPIVPVRLEGLHDILHPTWKMARPGRAAVRFGAPITVSGDDYAALAARVESAVRALGPAG